jgi:phospholipase/carboxylesterase
MEKRMPELNGPRTGPASSPPQQLIVLCHGLGADGHDLIDIAAAWTRAVPHAAFAAPDAPFPCDMAPMGRQWFSVADRTPALMEQGVRRAAGYLDSFIDAELARLSLPPDAYALMGFSQGAMTVLFTGLRRKVPPRAILAYSGALIAPEILAADRKAAGIRATVPVLLVHGEDDDVVPIVRSRDAEAGLRAGGIPVESLWCPQLGHGIDEAGLSMGALFLQRTFAAKSPG